jgi:hypothetical protein
MKFEQSQLLADLKYIITIVENPEFELSDKLLEDFLKRSTYIRKNIDKYINKVNREVKKIQ